MEQERKPKSKRVRDKQKRGRRAIIRKINVPKPKLYSQIPIEEEVGTIRYCNALKDCGHNCDGVKGETECLPCMNKDCTAETYAE